MFDYLMSDVHGHELRGACQPVGWTVLCNSVVMKRWYNSSPCGRKLSRKEHAESCLWPETECVCCCNNSFCSVNSSKPGYSGRVM